MKKYSIYYDMDSCGKYLDVDECIESDSLDEAVYMMQFLSDIDDGIIIYLNEIMLQVMIRGHKDISRCVLELHDARKGVCFSKSLYKKGLKENIAQDLEQYIKNPLDNGFVPESF